MKKIISMFVLLSFAALNSTAFSLGTSLISGEGLSDNKETKDGMYAMAQKQFLVDGPGSEKASRFDWGSPTNADTIGNLEKFLKNVKSVTAVDKSKRDELPEDWQKNKTLHTLMTEGLIKGLEAYRDSDARIKANVLRIKEGYYPLKKGEAPLARLEPAKDGIAWTLVVHSDFVKMWDHIRDNDVRFTYDFGDGQTRTVSLAAGLAFHIAKHELGDSSALDFDETNVLYPKGGGHITLMDDLSKGGYELTYDMAGRYWLDIEKDEKTANMIGGKYAEVNTAAILWFLGSYAMGELDDQTLLERILWLKNQKTEGSVNFPEQFPELAEKFDTFIEVADITRLLNFYFFAPKEGREVGALETIGRQTPTRMDEYNDRIKANNVDIENVLYVNGSISREPFMVIDPELGPTKATEREEKLAELGKTGLETTKMNSILHAAKTFNLSNIEVFVPDSMAKLFTGATQKNLGLLKKKKKNLVITEYNATNLQTLLRKQKKEGQKKIIITDSTTLDFITTMLSESQDNPDVMDHFRDVRVLNMELTNKRDKKDSPDYPEKLTARQSKMLMIAILSRLYESEDEDKFVRALLVEHLKGCIAAEELDEFLSFLGKTDSPDTAPADIFARINYFLNPLKAVSLIKVLENELKLIRLFWVYA